MREGLCCVCGLSAASSALAPGQAGPSAAAAPPGPPTLPLPRPRRREWPRRRGLGIALSATGVLRGVHPERGRPRQPASRPGQGKDPCALALPPGGTPPDSCHAGMSAHPSCGAGGSASAAELLPPPARCPRPRRHSGVQGCGGQTLIMRFLAPRLSGRRPPTAPSRPGGVGRPTQGSGPPAHGSGVSPSGRCPGLLPGLGATPAAGN